MKSLIFVRFLLPNKINSNLWSDILTLNKSTINASENKKKWKRWKNARRISPYTTRLVTFTLYDGAIFYFFYIKKVLSGSALATKT